MHHLARIKSLRAKVLIEDNGYSGEYAPAFSNKLHPCSAHVKINNASCKPYLPITFFLNKKSTDKWLLLNSLTKLFRR